MPSEAVTQFDVVGMPRQISAEVFLLVGTDSHVAGVNEIDFSGFRGDAGGEYRPSGASWPWPCQAGWFGKLFVVVVVIVVSAVVFGFVLHERFHALLTA
jgi:hypothetical protein